MAGAMDPSNSCLVSCALVTHFSRRVFPLTVQVSQSFASMTKDTPLWEAGGIMPSADNPTDSVCSYASVHDALGAKTSSYSDKYKQFVLDYAIEWEKVVTGRINEGLKTSEKLRRDLNHYQKKVESLRLSVNQAMARGKSVKSDTQEKLRRNEEKLIASKQSYNKAATDLCILMEEVTERSWRDLHPLLIKCAQFDSTLSNDESKVLGSLNQVVNQLKQVAVASGISPQPRIKDLGTLKPELLSTRPGGVVGLAIEAGLSPTSSDATSPMGSSADSAFQSQALAPGAVAPQGMGGFPVQVASAMPLAPAPAPASPAYQPPSTLSMLTLSQSSAPAPTLDDVYSANNSALTISSAPTSANLPPLAPAPASGPPPLPTSSFNDPSGANDYDSAYSGYSSGGYQSGTGSAAAPAAAPPPPPNMPPPPPPSYGVPAPDPPTSYAQPVTTSPWGSAADPPTVSAAPAPPGSYTYGTPPVQNSTNPFGY